VLLQLEYEPTFAAVNAVNPFTPPGRVPEITLYADGTVIYDGSFAGKRGVFVYGFGERVAARHHEHAIALGIDEVRSHEDDCRPSDGGPLCLSDASVVILRVRRPDGTLRELRNYAGWALSREAVLHAVYDRLELLQTPPGWGAELYQPERATLFLTADTDVGDASELERLPRWPLTPELFERVHAEDDVVLAIDAPTIRTLVAALGTNAVRSEAFRLGDRVAHLGLVPWLPGVDHRPLERWPAERAASNALPTGTPAVPR
jgi:hypothetical protein